MQNTPLHLNNPANSAYASEVWGAATDSEINRIQVLQNKILRIATNTPRLVQHIQLHNDLTIMQFIIEKFWRYHNNLLNVLRAVIFNIGKPSVSIRLKPRLTQDLFLIHKEYYSLLRIFYMSDISLRFYVNKLFFIFPELGVISLPLLFVTGVDSYIIMLKNTFL